MATLNTLFGDVLLLEERLKVLVRAAVLDALRNAPLLADTEAVLLSIVRGLEAPLRTQYASMEAKALAFARTVAGGPVAYNEGTGLEAGMLLYRNSALRAASVFVIDLNAEVARMLQTGMQPDAVRRTIANSLSADNPSRALASLLGGLAQAAASGVQETANTTMLSAMANPDTDGLPNADEDKWVWITVEDNRVCDDCEPRHNQIKSLNEWRTLGLPKSGFGVCGDRDRCMILPAEFADEELDLRMPVKLDRKRVMEIGARAKGLAGG